MHNVCVIGGGNVAHSIAATIACDETVLVVTRSPDRWSSSIEVLQEEESFRTVFPVLATAEVGEIVCAKYIFVSLPQYAVASILPGIINYASPNSVVIFVPTPAIIPECVQKFASKRVGVVGMQRVPFISRIVEYGKSVRISKSRSLHKLVSSAEVFNADLAIKIGRWFGGGVFFMSSFLSLIFSNSNPLLHPARLSVLFRNWRNKYYGYNPPFYGKWTNESSELYVAADKEMLSIMKKYPEINIDSDYESVLSHYGAKSAIELTDKLRTLSAFRDILSPMIFVGGRWLPDFSSRYFTEDVPYGTKTIQAYARRVHVSTPVIDAMIDAIDEIVSANEGSERVLYVEK